MFVVSSARAGSPRPARSGWSKLDSRWQLLPCDRYGASHAHHRERPTDRASAEQCHLSLLAELRSGRWRVGAVGGGLYGSSTQHANAATRPDAPSSAPQFCEEGQVALLGVGTIGRTFLATVVGMAGYVTVAGAKRCRRCRASLRHPAGMAQVRPASRRTTTQLQRFWPRPCISAGGAIAPQAHAGMSASPTIRRAPGKPPLKMADPAVSGEVVRDQRSGLVTVMVDVPRVIELTRRYGQRRRPQSPCPDDPRRRPPGRADDRPRSGTWGSA